MAYRLGIDAGSKTIKLVVLDEDGKVMTSQYRRHSSNIAKTLHEVLHNLHWRLGDMQVEPAITGSAGIGIAESLGIPFVQEVVATTTAVQQDYPQADAVIELGGEDAKVIYLSGGLEQRMNATCAGGTGGFIDTIAFMLGVRAADMSRLAYGSSRIYPIASRCAVFAQTDVRPLINAGASKADIAASALDAVVRQTLGGLACGRPLRGTVVFLGGPLEHISALATQFRKKLGLTKAQGIKPPDAHLFTVRGAALLAREEGADSIELAELIKRLDQLEGLESDLERLPPLFQSEQEYEDFKARHGQHAYPTKRTIDAKGPLCLGIDAGSTTVKLACVDSEGDLVYDLYEPTGGDTLKTLRDMLERMHRELLRPVCKGADPTCWIAHATATGYGEKLIRAMFGIDSGVVETAAHLRAATQACPDVSFVLDIGGQDMKALWVKDGQVVDAVLNEACSSGCGAFVEGTAYSLRTSPSRFAGLALKAKNPVDLGMRCTVFMTSRVRHAQKVGAALDDIAAGVAYSVIQNALYRIIGAERVASMGNRIMVQGGAFKSDAVLRAFELACGCEPIRLYQAHLMGAIGAALTALDRANSKGDLLSEQSSLLGVDELHDLEFKRRSLECTGCSNACALSVIQAGHQTFISGNRCDNGQLELERRASSQAHLKNKSGAAPVAYSCSPENAASAEASSAGCASGDKGILARAVSDAKEDGESAPNARRLGFAPKRDGEIFNEPSSSSNQDEISPAFVGCRIDSVTSDVDSPSSDMANSGSLANGAPNIVALERELLGAYEGMAVEADSLRSSVAIGLMNAMELYATVPFWHEVLLALGFRVAVASVASEQVHASEAWETMPSESVCYPAKLAHLRYFDLVEEGVDSVFMPTYERKSHCAVSSGYAHALADNLEPAMPKLLIPELVSYKPKAIAEDAASVGILEEAIGPLAQWAGAPLQPGEVARALERGRVAQERYEQKVAQATKKALDWIESDQSRHGIVFLGRSYASDRAVSKGIDEELQKLGFAVLSLRGLESILRTQPKPPLADNDWRAAKRFVAAATFAAAHSQLDVVGLQPFGCGYDAISYAKVGDILAEVDRPCTVLKVDDIVDLEHIRIRLRTLATAIEMRAPAHRRQTDVLGERPGEELTRIDCSASDEGEHSSGASSDSQRQAPTSFAATVLESDPTTMRRDTIKDTCLPAQALAAQVIDSIRSGAASSSIQLPSVCKGCMLDAVPLMVERALGHPVQVEWVDVPNAYANLAGIESCCQSEPDEQRVPPRIGIVGNALMCFQPALNDGLFELLEALGARPVLPNPALIQGDDVRYLEQLQAFCDAGIHDVVYLQSFGCLKGHVQSRGALHQLKRKFPELAITVIDYDPEASALNRENRIRLVVQAAKRRLGHDQLQS